MSKTAKEYTDELISRMKQSQKFVIIRSVPEHFEFRGPVPFNISINDKGVMRFTLYATSIEEANQRVDEYLNPYE